MREPSSTTAGVKQHKDTSPTLLRQVDDKARGEACRMAGLELIRNGHEKEAVDQLLKARKFLPEIKGIAHPLAVLYDREGQFGKAEQEYHLALAEMPKDGMLRSDYGYFLYVRGDLNEAEKQLRKAVQLSPRYVTASVNLGLVLGEQKKYEDARTVFTKALGEAAARHNMGMILARHGQTEAGRTELEQALVLDPGQKASQLALQTMEGLSNNHEESGIVQINFKQE